MRGFISAGRDSDRVFAAQQRFSSGKSTDDVLVAKRFTKTGYLNTHDTSAETKPDLPLEIAHVLLIDVVGYSKLLVNEQIELLQELWSLAPK